MSDDLLQRDLSLLSQRAAAAATAPAVGTVIRRAVKRRQRRRVAAGAVVPIVAAAVIVGVSLAHSGSGQSVTVAGPLTNRSPNVVRSAPPLIMPATMKIEGNGVLRRCILVDDPVTSKGDASSRGALRKGPTGLTVVWKPSQVGKGRCVSTVTSVGAARAAKTLAALDVTKPASRSIAAPQQAYSPGSVDLVFRYASGKPISVVTVTLGSNGVVRLADGRQYVNAAIEAQIKLLDPPAWARSNSGLSGIHP
jgi:hypothetical protein